MAECLISTAKTPDEADYLRRRRVAGKRKQARKERFLSEMDRVMPRNGLINLIQPHYSKGKGDHPAFVFMAVVRIDLMQNYFNDSDPAVEGGGNYRVQHLTNPVRCSHALSRTQH